MLIAICLMATMVHADPQDHLPSGERRGASMCYDLDGFKQLLLLSAKFEAVENARAQFVEKTVVQRKIIDAYKATDHIQLDTIESLKNENSHLFDLWKDENKRRHEAENIPKWGGAVGWITAGVMTFVAAGAVTYAVTK
jgi:hypothetical protein